MPVETDKSREVAALMYQALNARYSSNVTVSWQVPALGLSAQAFLIAGATQSVNDLTRWLLAAAIVAIGVVVTITGQYFDYGSWVDRQLLDRYEKGALSPNSVNQDLLLRHALDNFQRMDELGFKSKKDLSSRLGESWLVRLGGSRLLWAALQVLVSAVGAIAAVVR